MKFSFAIIVALFRVCHGDDCYFPYNLAAEEKGVFGWNLTYADTPCLIWFTATLPGALRLDFNNKIFAPRKEKKSCLSEYIKVQNGDATWTLCHNNVTTPVQIGVPGQSGHLDATSPVIVLVRWVGALHNFISYLGRFIFVPLPSIAKSGKVEGNALAEIITVKTCGQPKINNVMRNLTLNPGETARFRCSVDMKCMVSYIQWYHEMNNGSMRLLRTGATQGNPFGYTVRRVNPNDAGFYSCVVGNILGETVSSAYLEINSSPRAQVEAGTTRNPPLASTTAPWVDMNLAVTSSGNVATSAGKVATSKIVNGTSSTAAAAPVASFNFLLCFLVVGLVMGGTRMS